MTMGIEIQDLKNELTINPASLPYLALTEANDVANANVINNSDGANPRTVNNAKVDTGDIRGSVTFAGFDGLVTAEQSWLEWLTSNGEIPVNAETLQQLAGIPTATGSIWAAADRIAMNAAMAALMQRQTSRADELGFGFISPGQIAEARFLP